MQSIAMRTIRSSPYGFTATDCSCLFVFLLVLFVSFGFNNLFSTVHAVGADVVTQVCFTGTGVSGQSRR
jgi:hypothetical protein